MSGFYFLTHPNDYLKGGCNFYINWQMNNSAVFWHILNLKRPCESACKSESFSAMNASIPAYSFINLLSVYCWRRPITLTIYVQLILTARQTRAGMAKIGVEGISQRSAKTWFGAFKIVARSSLPLISASNRPNLTFIFLNRHSKSRGI